MMVCLDWIELSRRRKELCGLRDDFIPAEILS